MAARMELGEREVVMTQTGLDRRESIFHIWTNDSFWFRRLESVGATLIREADGGREYQVDSRQILIRKIPAKRKGKHDNSSFFKGKAMSEAMSRESDLPMQ